MRQGGIGATAAWTQGQGRADGTLDLDCKITNGLLYVREESKPKFWFACLFIRVL
jgi:hypothetical protein